MCCVHPFKNASSVIFVTVVNIFRRSALFQLILGMWRECCSCGCDSITLPPQLRLFFLPAAEVGEKTVSSCRRKVSSPSLDHGVMILREALSPWPPYHVLDCLFRVVLPLWIGTNVQEFFFTSKILDLFAIDCRTVMRFASNIRILREKCKTHRTFTSPHTPRVGKYNRFRFVQHHPCLTSERPPPKRRA